MQVDLSESRSRAFNLFLRFIQLGISTLVAIIVVRFYSVNCSGAFYQVVLVVSIMLIGISVVANMCFRCRQGFNKTFFFVLLAGCIIIAVVGLIVSFAGYGQANVCASNRVTYRFIVIQTLIIVIIEAIILFGSFFWAQRYSNSPGNIVWIFMFFSFNWNPKYHTLMLLIGILAIIVSAASFIINMVAGAMGVTSKMKRAILVTWTVCMIVMLANEVLAIATYMQNSKYQSYNDMQAKKVLLIFVILNMVEFFFWLFGLLTLQQQNGDLVRDSLMSQGFGADDNRINQDDGRGIGTLK